MKRLTLLFLLLSVSLAIGADRYAVATGNWNDTATWSTMDGGGAGASAPIAGDTAYLTATSGAITVTLSAAAACAILNCTGFTGTLAMGAQNLTITGNITFVAGMTLTGSTSRLIWSTGGGTITSNGKAVPGNMTISSAATYTLADALTVTNQLLLSSSVVFSGAFDITCAYFSAYAGTVQLVSGQKLIVTNSFVMGHTANSGGVSPVTLRAVTASSVAYIQYTGAEADCSSFKAIFTDIDWSTNSTPVTGLDNWYGGTLTRTVGITNRTSADIGGGGGSFTFGN